jgi:hypothetical protein
MKTGILRSVLLEFAIVAAAPFVGVATARAQAAPNNRVAREVMIAVAPNQLAQPRAAPAAANAATAAPGLRAIVPAVRPARPFINAPHNPAPAPSVVTIPTAPLSSMVLRSGQKPAAVDLVNTPLKLHQGELLVSKTATTSEALPPGAATRPGATAFRLPYEARFVDDQGALKTAEIVAELSGGGLRPSSSGPDFTTDLFVMLREKDTSRLGAPLPEPMQLAVTAAVDKISTTPLVIEQLNDWKTTTLEASDPADSVTVRIAPSFDVNVLELPVPVVRPRLSLTADPPRPQGFGLESVTVGIRVDGLPNPAGRVVMLSASSGNLALSKVTLDSNGTATTELRTTGTGVATISATSSTMVQAPSAVLTFVWPWAFLVFSVLGGVVGSVGAVLGRNSEKETKPWLREVARGTVIGFITAAATAAGFNVTTFHVPAHGGEVVSFAVAALVALGFGFGLTLKSSASESTTTVAS